MNHDTQKSPEFDSMLRSIEDMELLELSHVAVMTARALASRGDSIPSEALPDLAIALDYIYSSQSE